MKNRSLTKWLPPFTVGFKSIFIVFLAVIFLVELVLHLRLQMTTDGAFLHYVAYLINEHGFVPYRDIFEINMPGTYLFHMSIGKFLGYSNLAYYLVSSVWILLILGVTWLFMQNISKTVALAACLFFGLIYLKIAPNYMALQRDFILILPIATAVFLVFKYQTSPLIHFLLGVLFAMAALVKPHAVIGLPVLIFFSLIQNESKIVPKKIAFSFMLGGGFALVGGLMTLALPFLWLWKIDALASFWAIFSSYTPLYAQMSGNFEFQESVGRIRYILDLYSGFGGYGSLLIASILGLYFILRYATSIKTKKRAILLLVLAFVYSLYAAIGSKLWLYHWMPFVYFASLSAALLFFSPPDKTYKQLPYPKILPPLMFIGIVIMYLPIAHISQIKKNFTDITNIHEQIILHDQDVHVFSSPATNEIITKTTQYLKQHLEPHDKVQSLGMATGITQAMLFSKAVLATPYIYDIQFYHHVSSDYIKQLRADFMQRLQQKKPKFIIKVQEGAPFKSKVSGIDVNYEFPELAALIQRYYKKSYSGNGFTIFRKK
ncbi:hypothetical protein QUF74_05965 [Candidatus Halobeggiatoa sp. HSG11]|nr:hypothetical protein [Candidatus Halobeggiatoa sp. HSG11]